MSSIEREVYIHASPTAVVSALAGSRWAPAIDVRPEGVGARVLIHAVAEPPPLADALEMAMLDDVCAAKRGLERGSADQLDVAAGKSM